MLIKSGHELIFFSVKKNEKYWILFRDFMNLIQKLVLNLFFILKVFY